MKNVIRSGVILLLLGSITISCSQPGERLQNEFTIKIPTGWFEVSDSIKQELKAKNVPDLKAYITAYTMSPSKQLVKPYFTVNYHEIPGIANASFKDVIMQQTRILGNRGIEGGLDVDSTQKKFYVDAVINDQPVILGFSPGGKGIVYFNYFFDVPISEVEIHNCLGIFRSIEHRRRFRNSH